MNSINFKFRNNKYTATVVIKQKCINKEAKAKYVTSAVSKWLLTASYCYGSVANCGKMK